MFIGEFRHSLDDKFRVCLPARLRELMPKEDVDQPLYLCRGQGDCLYLYPQSRWLELTAGLAKPAFGAAEALRFARLFFSSAGQAAVDGQGRIRIPDSLCRIATLVKDVVFVGVFDRIEIWDAGKWSEFSRTHEALFAHMAEQAAKQGERGVDG